MTAAVGAPAADRAATWWRNAVVYQIYPRSFADSNADGIGDLPGVTSRLAYLAGLGVDALWLSPFYRSPLADGGYDISDHREVDPRLGTLADFDALLEGAHRLSLKVIVDIVPNHTSDQHPWFVEALGAAPGSAARDRYIFRDGIGTDGGLAPSDWRSHFGGSAWERVSDGQWYCHLFAREQPDLHWANPEIGDEFVSILRFWADRGVDGFRVDVAHTLAKDLAEPLRSQPNLDLQLPLDGSDPLYDRDEVHAIYERWRTVFDEYDPPRMAVAETWHPTTPRSHHYARPSELGQVFDFSLMKCGWDRDQIEAAIRRSIEDHRSAGGGLTWVLSSHDAVRHGSRLALPPGVTVEAWLLSNGTDPVISMAIGRRRARAATMLLLALPGSAYLYQGEELGLLEVADLPAAVLRDPTWDRSGHTAKGRDGCRVPLPWTEHAPSFGFGDNGTWLPQPAWFAPLSMAAQDGVSGSCLTMYRSALAWRRRLQVDDSELEWSPTAEPGVLSFRRSNGWSCTVNFSAVPVAVPPGGASGPMVLASGPLDSGALPPDTAIWFDGSAGG